MRAVLLAILVVTCSAGSIARAQDAEALVAEGIALREDGRDADALARFVEANRIAPSARTLAQIALAEQALGHFVDAEAHLSAALADAGDRFITRNRALLEAALAEIRGQIGELAITGGVPGASITVGGAPRGTLPLEAPLRVDPGQAHVEVRADGHDPFEAEVEVAPGARAELAVILRAISTTTLEPTPEPAPIATTPDRGADWMLPTAIALAGAGVAGLAVGTGLAIVREEHAQARQSCSDVDPACRDHYQAAVDAETGAIASFVIGGVLAAGGTALLVVALTQQTPGTERAISCAPGVLAIGCRARF